MKVWRCRAVADNVRRNPPQDATKCKYKDGDICTYYYAHNLPCDAQEYVLIPVSDKPVLQNVAMPPDINAIPMRLGFVRGKLDQIEDDQAVIDGLFQ